MISVNTYPVLPLRDLVMFPHMIVPLFVGREKSVKALDEATISHNNTILLVAQKDANKDEPKPTDLYKIGVLAVILQTLKLQDGTVKILVEGIRRVKILKYHNEGSLFHGDTRNFEDKKFIESDKDITALNRSIINKFEVYVKLNRKVNAEILGSLSQITDINKFCDAVSAHLMVKVNKKQELLEITDVVKKLEKILLILDSEIEVLNMETKIIRRVRTQIEKNQKDYYLNEQLKAIHKELGEDDYKEEFNNLAAKLKKLKLSKEARERVDSELKKLRTMNHISSEATVIRNYLEWFVDLPWDEHSQVNNDIVKAEEVLNKDHYGLNKVKERILEYLAVNTRTQNTNSPIICLVGPPGVGKTSLAKSVAEATGRAFAKISLGGLRDEAEIKGHRRTYIGAQPGKIIQAIKKSKTNNPIILLDEIDKMSSDFRGDPAAAMLEVLDPAQNHTFSDHYIEVDYDLSKVMFIATANTANIPRPLLDRMEVIRVSGYTEEEKMEIAKNHLIAKQFKSHGLEEGELKITDDAIRDIIHYYTREAGVRNLDRDIAKICRKIVKEILTTKDEKLQTVDAENLHKYLSVRKFTSNEIEKDDLVGVTTGLAYTEVGGDILSIEALITYGKGDIKITGKLGEVMRESAQAALSYVRYKATELGIDPDLFKRRDIHIHVPEGATPKDGPSAGIALYTSIASAFTLIPVKKSVAMTGEITLRGRVLPIGGLKEKLLAALRGGVTTALIPKQNLKDLEEIPDNVKTKIKIITVDSVDEVLKIALVSQPQAIEWTEKWSKNDDYNKSVDAEIVAH